MQTERHNPKTPKELVRQAVGNSEYIREVTGQPLIPPAFSPVESLGSMTVKNAKSIFGTKRWDIFTTVLRHELAGKDLPDEQAWEIGRKLRLLNNIDHYIANHHANPDEQILFPKQMDAFESLGTFLKNGGTEGYFKLPTAFGKTVMFSEFIKAANTKTLVIVPTMDLIEQTQDKIEEYSPDTPIGTVYSKSKNFGEQVTVITYNSLIRWVEERVPPEEIGNFQPYDYDLVILDEAHHALGEQSKEALEAFPQAIKLGFTATPYYDEERNLANLLGEMIYGLSIKEAVEEGLLSGFRTWIAKTNTDLSQVEVNPETGDYNQAQLARAVDTAARNKAAAELYKTHFDGEQTIVTCITIEHARHVADEFRKQGIAAEAIYGDLGNKRKVILDRFKDGETKVLVSSKLLDEGVDLPTASRLINLKPTLSPVVAEQRGGRVLRVDPNNTNKEAIIVDFVDVAMQGGLPVTFAEVAGSARIENPRGIYYQPTDEQRDYQPTRYLGGIEGLQVTTDITEIMRIVSEAQTARAPLVPNSFVEISTNQLKEIYDVAHATVHRSLKSLLRTNPDEFFQRDRRGKFYASPEGLEIIGASLEALRIPEGFSTINLTDLYREVGVSDVMTTRIVGILTGTNPDEIKYRGEKKASVITTEQGLTLLRNKLTEWKELGEKFTPIEAEQLAQEAGEGISVKMVRRMVYKLAPTYPGHFPKYTMGGENGIYLASPEGLQLLKDQLTGKTTPEGYIRLEVTELAQEFGILGRDLYTRALNLFNERPDLVIRRGRAQPIDISIEGMDLLRSDLESRKGMVRIPFADLTQIPGYTPASAHMRLRVVMRKYPDLFIRGGAVSLATPEGLALLQTEVASMRRPDGYEPLNMKSLVKDYSSSYRSINAQIAIISEQTPEAFIQKGRTGYIATEQGINLLRERLNQLQKNKEMNSLQSSRDAMIALSQNLSSGTVSSEYGSELWKRRATRFLVGTRNQTSLDIAQVAAKMNCDVDEVVRLETGQATLEDLQGDLPKRYAEAIGNPGSYSLYNLLFHVEFGVTLPEAA